MMPLLLASMLTLNGSPLLVELQTSTDPPPSLAVEWQQMKHSQDVTRHLAAQIALRVFSASFDMFGTAICQDNNPACFEANPVFKSYNAVAAFKGISVPLHFAGSWWLLDRGHKKASWIMTGAVCAFEFFLGARALKIAGEAPE